MNASFRVSVLYLLLLIPQHGNSPLPAMQSWLQKDQDDGFVQRDMTSSLTGGDESFGSAHQTYQNSLIRKKKSESLGDDILGSDFGKFAAKYEENHNQLFPQTNAIFDGRYVNQEYSAPVAENSRSNGIFDELDSESLPSNKFRSRTSNMRNPIHETSVSRSDLFALAPSADKGLNFGESLPLENTYGSLEDDSIRRMGNQEYRDANEAEDQNSQFFNDNEYYESGDNAMTADENLNAADYDQLLNDHVYMQKRDEIKQAKPNPSSLQTMSDGILNPQLTEVRARAFDNSPDPDLFWNLSPDVRSQSLSNIIRNSQRALEDVKKFQQSLAYKQGEGTDKRGVKRENEDQCFRKYEKSFSFDDKRLKREDEDEQKNMKTGTDEGGGGEYEDEEGKGHKDEEEYYEEADLSDDESGYVGRRTGESKQKYVKREVVQNPDAKDSKVIQTENNSDDYALNLGNAPIEHLEKTKKPYREGEKPKKKSVRKGVKIWDEWGKWSPCSVTCGVGRCTRWRHCVGGGCAQGEKEAQIKRCTNPAC